MRISRAGLLVLLAMSVPVIVELRTVLSFFNIELSLVGALAIGVVGITLILFWATFPTEEEMGANN